MDLEICVNSIQSAYNAKAGGATRIELCQALEQGGTTPSYSTIEYCTNELKLRTYVLIRPRTGNFIYNSLEFDNIRREVIVCRQLGATGVVVGFLDNNLDVDISKTKEIVDLAGEMEVTFHRAFDICNNPMQNLERVIDCGCSRILTSGCKATAYQGMDMLKKLVGQANGRIKIMAGSGINADNAIEIINTTGVSEVHASCKHVVGNWNETDAEHFLDPSNSIYSETDSNEVRRMSTLITQI
ncbi:MAG: copper homeostasis protein CutC [Bacteroidales bacterium]|nr:copper homeostasis protein CutC [Bacteroidales bacterium]